MTIHEEQNIISNLNNIIVLAEFIPSLLFKEELQYWNARKRGLQEEQMVTQLTVL